MNCNLVVPVFPVAFVLKSPVKKVFVHKFNCLKFSNIKQNKIYTNV